MFAKDKQKLYIDPKNLRIFKLKQADMVEVCCATSFDERFDPKNVLTANTKEFWVSTGLYPQELVF